MQTLGLEHVYELFPRRYVFPFVQRWKVVDFGCYLSVHLQAIKNSRMTVGTWYDLLDLLLVSLLCSDLS